KPAPNMTCLKACAKIYYGLSLEGGGAVLAGARLLDKPAMLGAEEGTSIASVFFRGVLPYRLPFNAFGTRVLGGVLGRATPWIGAALLAIDAGGIGSCVHQCHKDNWFP